MTPPVQGAHITFDVETIAPQPAAVVRAEVPLDEIRTAFDRGLGEVMRVTRRQGIAVTGPPFGFYPRKPAATVEIFVGFPVSAPVTVEGDVTSFELPGGQVVTGVHIGPYERLEESYRALAEWAAAEGLELAGHMWESYLTDPAGQPDPGTWRTRLSWPLARVAPETAAAGPALTATERSTGAQTLGDMVLRAGDRHAGPALTERSAGRTVEISYAGLASAARDVARGLIALGVAPGDRVCVLAQTRPEWTIVDMGVFCAGAVVAPIYATNSPEECAYVLRHAEATAVVCEDAAQVAKIAQVRDTCPALRHVIVMEGEAEGAIGLDELKAAGEGVPAEAVDERVAAVAPGDLATIIYTSGTTGPPKGCMLTHENFLAATHAYQERLDMTREDVPIVYFMFLPLAHSLARIIEISVLDVGGTLAFWSRRPERLLDDIREARPTYFPSVPRVFEKIYTAAHAGVAEQSRVRQSVFHWAIGVGRRARPALRAGEPVPRPLAWQHRLADRLVLSKVRDLFGGRLELAASGAAPIGKEILEFFDACGVLVLEGWGMTETAAAGTINTTGALRFGTVGTPLPGTEIRIADDGELLMRGPTVFRGYFHNEEATAATLLDGWLATGDLASVDDDGFVSIVGRKKELIITSSGKNISPANIENLLKESRWISQAVVVGDDRPYLVALITLDPEEAPKLAEQLGVDPAPGSMAGDPLVRGEIQKAVDAVNARLARIEQIKRFAILDHDLTQAGGELTPTLKIRRSIVTREFAPEIEALYAAPKG